MRSVGRAAYGAVGGAGGTLALSGLRKLLGRIGLVQETAPEQVVERLEELGLVEGWPSGSRRLLAVAAHVAYGVGIGAVLGLLRGERDGVAEETAVGSALGILAWGAGWATWLPLTGVHRPPWKQRTPRVLLPVMDHAAFGAVWGFVYWLLRSGRV
ncbi:MAG TPA: hypothetical protein VK869_10040 [Rubrobacteraceae bacterium]|nr:hypothetical protein [Rubrobacteraceae bacterium]